MVLSFEVGIEEEDGIIGVFSHTVQLQLQPVAATVAARTATFFFTQLTVIVYSCYIRCPAYAQQFSFDGPRV